jgi:hypothetical protein
VANRSLEILSLRHGRYELSSSAAGEGKIRSEILPAFEFDLAALD